MDSGLIVLLVYVAVVLLLFSAAGFYRQYTGTEWEDMDGPVILIWPMAICVFAVAIICHRFIKGGEFIAAWMKARS